MTTKAIFDARNNGPLRLTVRFATAEPDLTLAISDPGETTIVALKRQIRVQLPPDSANRRLRLIHGGRVLSDTSVVTDILRYTPRAAVVDSAVDGSEADGKHGGKGKGKARLEDDVAAGDASRRVELFIHCSIGDQLSAGELADEATQAERTKSLREPGRRMSGSSSQPRPNTTPPALTGFDRLLASGLSPAEVASLREQFLEIQSYAYTPDTMPTAEEMRLLEDRWIDEAADGGGGGGGGALGETATTGRSSYEDMLLGNILGFFWPLGAIVWLLREEGVWNARRQMAVFPGITLNMLLALIRMGFAG